MSFNNLQEGGGVDVKDEGLTIATKARSIDFAGAGVTGGAVGKDVTETIPGGTSYTDEEAQDAVGAMIDTSLVYTDSGPLLKVNEAYAHTWTVAQTVLRAALGTTPSDAWLLTNTTAAANGAQQISPSLHWSGRGWNSGGGGSSQSIDFRTYLLPVQGASGATGILKTQMSRAGAAYADVWTLSTSGEVVSSIQSGVGAVTGYEISGPWGNSSPGTTRAQRYNSTAGYNEIDFTYSGTLRQALLGSSNGDLNFYASGGNYFAFYYGNSGLSSNSLFAYLYPTAFVHNSGYGAFASGVHAGNQGAPTSTLQSAGSTALKVTRKVAAFNFDSTATVYLLDGAAAAACTGTPSTTSCSSYTGSGQATCESHLPCVWNPGSSCSAFDNESGMGTCAGTSGCSVVTAACSGAGDQSSCEAQDDAYGGNCTWDMGSNTCGSYTNTTDCNAASPCYANVSGDCGTLSDGGGDGSACATQPECSYDSGSGTCSGSYFVSCDGDNSTYSCNGNYNTGSCTGTYGQACTGTVTCASYGSSGPCAGEPGCAWLTVLSSTLPQMSTCPDRLYAGYNDDTGGADAVIYAYSGETIEGASSVTLPQPGDSVIVVNHKRDSSCNDFLTEGACTPTGCSVVYANCTWNGSSCEGHASCTGVGDQPTCEATTYFSYCSGTYNINKDWKIIADNRSKSGTYTPTLYNTTNVGASTARLATYVRVQNTVTVSGQLEIDPTATGAVLLGISLPIPSAFTTAYQLGGVGSTIGIANESYGIEADATNDRASMKNIAVSTANHVVCYTFTYQIL